MTLTNGDRVRLTKRGGGEGTVRGEPGADGSAYVRLDSGSSCTLRGDELEVVTETKQWPPKGLETK